MENKIKMKSIPFFNTGINLQLSNDSFIQNLHFTAELTQGYSEEHLPQTIKRHGMQIVSCYAVHCD